MSTASAEKDSRSFFFCAGSATARKTHQRSAAHFHLDAAAVATFTTASHENVAELQLRVERSGKAHRINNRR